MSFTFTDAHDGDCSPAKPGKCCQAMALLRARLDPALVIKFLELCRPPAPAIETTPAPPPPPDPLDEPVDNWDISTRTAMGLKHHQVTTLRELVQLTELQMRSVPNFGRKSLNELKSILAAKGLHFGMNP